MGASHAALNGYPLFLTPLKQGPNDLFFWGPGIARPTGFRGQIHRFVLHDRDPFLDLVQMTLLLESG